MTRVMCDTGSAFRGESAMGRLTITVDDEVLRKARMRTLEQGSSVTAVLRELLEAYAGAWRGQSAAAADLMALSHQFEWRRGGRSWTRDSLHERE